MSRPRVFVVQQPAYYDRAKACWIEKYDLSAAEEHGELVYLFGQGNIYKDRMVNAISRLHEALADYSPDDYVLALGDPVAIAATAMVAGVFNGGRLNLLKYDRITGRYESYSINVNITGIAI